MKYLYSDNVNEVIGANKYIDNNTIIEKLIDNFYQQILFPEDQQLIDVAFNKQLQQPVLDKFLSSWDIEEFGAQRAILLSYVQKDRPDLNFHEYTGPRLSGLLKYYRFQNLNLMSHYTKICRALNSKGIIPLIMKGGAMKYLRPELPRVMGDIDILVPADDFAVACQTVEELGYFYEKNDKAHSIDLHLTPEGEEGVLDIHRWLYLGAKYDKTFMNKFFERASKHKIFGTDTYLPCNEDMIFIDLLNLAKNLHKNTSIKGVLYNLFDIQYLLASKPDFNWNLVVKSTTDTNTQVPMYFAMRFANKIVPGLLPQELFENKKLEKSIARYCDMVMYTRFYLFDLRAVCKKIRIKNALCHLSVMKEYLKYKPKYFMLKMMKKNHFLVKCFLNLHK